MNIHYIQPYSRSKNIGLCINNAIESIKTHEDDFIVLTDHDVLWLLPDSKAQLEEILEQTDYDILGAVTNRLASPHQLVSGAFDNWDIKYHIGIAKQLQTKYRNGTMPTNKVLAAFCLCFRVSTWDKLGGFEENSIRFDTLFSNKAHKAGMKLGIMPGIYVFHLYRPWSNNPSQSIKHLL